MKEIIHNNKLKSWLFYFSIAVAAIAAYKIIMEIDSIYSYIRGALQIISPFIAGFILAYILDLPCSKLRHFYSSRKNKVLSKNANTISVLTVYLVLIFLIVFLIRLVLPVVFQNIYYFVRNFPTYYNNAQYLIEYINSLELISLDISLNSLIQTFQKYGLDTLSESFSAVFGVGSTLFKCFISLVTSIYVLLEKDKFLAFMKRLTSAFLPRTVYTYTSKYISTLNSYFKKYIYCQTIDGCILGTLATIELFLLGSPFALTLGIMLGIVNYIPYFGSIFGSLIAVVVVTFTQGLSTGALALVVLIVTQQIDGNIIQPKLMGGSFNISPLIIIISVTIGSSIAGPFGMIVAIPIAAVLKDILNESISAVEAYRKLNENN